MADIERARQLRQDDTWAEKLMWRWHPLGIYYLD